MSDSHGPHFPKGPPSPLPNRKREPDVMVPRRTFICGTKKVVESKTRPGRWLVACATCGTATARSFMTKSEAISVCVDLSSHPCRAKGCGVR
jgi:hypothetical protein